MIKSLSSLPAISLLWVASVLASLPVYAETVEIRPLLLDTKDGQRVEYRSKDLIIGIVPPLMFPWTEDKRQFFRDQWNGWSASGARLFLRPNYMLDGHNLPVVFARQLGEDFSFAASHGLMGTDFDSLTGQWAAQGLNLYMLARLHDRPDLDVARVLDEYFSAFGPARSAVDAYFKHFERVSGAVTDGPDNDAGLHWSYFYRGASRIFTPEVMAEGRRLIEQAISAAPESPARERVAFLEKGLRHAELTLAAQQACENYRTLGDIAAYAAALQELDDFRAAVEGDFVANMAYLAWAESRTWHRALVKSATAPAGMPRPPVAAGENVVFDPGFEERRERWKQHHFCGDVAFDLDASEPHSGKLSARIVCCALGDEQFEKQHGSRVWARWYQPDIPVDPQRTYRLRVWVRTSPAFNGRIAIWATGTTKQTMAAERLNTQGKWREVIIEGIQPAAKSMTIYLNLFDGTGTAWFDGAELSAEP